jgi:integrase
LNLTVDRVDFEEGTLTFETLKRRKRGLFRSVPVPQSLLDALDLLHGLREKSGRERKQRIWEWSRSTAWRRVKEVMDTAGLCGIKATPKGLRHGFGIACNQNEVQLNMAQKWLGHANIKTTAPKQASDR